MVSKRVLNPKNLTAEIITVKKVIITIFILLIPVFAYSLALESFVNNAVIFQNNRDLDISFLKDEQFKDALLSQGIVFPKQVRQLTISGIGMGSEKIVYKLEFRMKNGATKNLKIAFFIQDFDGYDLLDIKIINERFYKDYWYMKKRKFFELCVPYFYQKDNYVIGEYVEVEQSNLHRNDAIIARNTFYWNTFGDDMQGYFHPDFTKGGNICLLKNGKVKIIDYPLTFKGFDVRWRTQTIKGLFKHEISDRNLEKVIQPLNEYIYKYAFGLQIKILASIYLYINKDLIEDFNDIIDYNKDILYSI